MTTSLKKQNIFKEIEETLIQRFDFDDECKTKPLTLEHQLDDIIPDSITSVEFCMDLEDTFRISLHDYKFVNDIKTIGQLVNAVDFLSK